MKVIISCSSRKNGESYTHNGQPINFISRVNGVIENPGNYFHPDDLIPNENSSWRDVITQQEIRHDLIPAHELYQDPIYNSLFDHFGIDLFIFSAGWGLVRADYKLPRYDVTFSNRQSTPKYTRRDNNDHFNDFNQLLGLNPEELLLFMGGMDYVMPFYGLTENMPNEKIIVYRNQNLLDNLPNLDNNNFQFLYYQTNRCTNWHYEFAKRLINNEIEL